LKFGQAILDAVFVQKISNLRRTCDLVLASKCTNFYKIPISILGAMNQKQIYFGVWATRATKKLFIFQLFWVEIFFNFFGLNFFHKFFTKFLTPKIP
jgi:hypothetical protein